MKVEIGPYVDSLEERHIVIECDRYDAWDCDHTMAMLIHPLMKNFFEDRRRVGGVKIIVASDFDECEKYKEQIPYLFSNKEEEDYLLLLSIRSAKDKEDFVISDEAKTILENDIDDPIEYFEMLYEWIVLQIIRSFELILSEYDDELYDTEDYNVFVENMKKREAEIDLGLFLFGKFFQSFWT